MAQLSRDVASSLIYEELPQLIEVMEFRSRPAVDTATRLLIARAGISATLFLLYVPVHDCGRHNGTLASLHRSESLLHSHAGSAPTIVSTISISF